MTSNLLQGTYGEKVVSRHFLRLLLTLLFFFNPAISAILAFICLASNVDKKFVRFIVGLFFGLYGYLFIPAYDFDIVEHYQYFSEYLGKSSEEFAYLMGVNSRPDILLYSLYWLIGKVYDNYQIVGFIGAFPFYFLMLLTIDNVFKTYLPSKRVPSTYLMLFAIFLSLTVPWTFSTMRNGNAIILFVFLLTRDKGDRAFIRDCFLFALPGLIHFSLFPISLLYIITKYASFRLIKGLSALMILAFPFIEAILTFFYSILSKVGGVGYFISAKINSYVIVGTNVNFYTGSSFRYYFAVIPILIIVILTWIYVERKKILNVGSNFHLLHKFVLVLIAFTICFVTTYMFARVHLLYIYIFPIYFLHLIYNRSVAMSLRKFLMAFMVYLALSFFPSLFLGREYRGVNPKLLFSDLITILNSNVEPQDYWEP